MENENSEQNKPNDSIVNKFDKTISFLKRTGKLSVSILNGVFGDELEKREIHLATKMNFYINEEPLDVTVESIQKEYPQLTSKVCILVHGLVSDEIMWNFSGSHENYGTLLQKDLQFTPFYIRYNSGLHISDNGKTFTDLIEDLINNYPIPIQELVLIGHSMGGLVIRSACYYAEKKSHSWVKKLNKVFFLGSPHLGAPLEKFGNVVTAILGQIPNPFTYLTKNAINKRSAGIKDLRFGYIIEEDWKDKDPDAFLQNNKNPVPLLENVKYFIISGTITENPESFLATWIGDAMVRKDSSLGKSRNQDHALTFLEEHHRQFPGIAHIKLMRDSSIYQQILEWCKIS